MKMKISKRTKISTLDKRKLNKVIAMLYNDARFSKEDVTFMVNNGRLCDIEDVIDLDKVF